MRWGALAICAVAAAAAAPRSARAGAAVTPGLRLSVEERYDDDALLMDAGVGQLMTKLVPQVGLDVRGRTVESNGWYAADLLYRHGSGTLSLDHRGRLQLGARLSERARVDASVRAWRVSDPTSLPRLGVARSLSPVLYGRAEARGQLQLSGRWTAGLGYTFEGAQIYDGRGLAGFVHSPSADAWYRLSRITELGVEARLQQFAFGAEGALAGSGAVSLRHRFTRLLSGVARVGGGLYSAGGDLQPRPYPRLGLELARDGERVDLALVLGHDLIGASGFTAALWSDYGSALFDWRIAEPLKLYGAASFYRNGRAPDTGLWPLGAAGSTQGYALAAGVEWRVGRALTLQLQGDRHAQIGAPAAGVMDLSRNVLSARAVVTPFEWAPGRGW